MLLFSSYVFLTNLLVPLSLVQKVAIVSEKGEVRGHLTVSIRYMSGNSSFALCMCETLMLIVDDEMDDKSLREASVLDFEKDSYTPNVSSQIRYNISIIYSITGFPSSVRLQ